MGCDKFFKKIVNFLKKCWENYTWFSMVAMNGERGDEIYRLNQLKKLKKPNNIC